MTDKQLMEKAVAARENAYVPYSNFKVGAALLTKSGKAYTGCNIENASFGATCCAERTAFFKAISEGDKDFEKIAVVGGREELLPFCSPCGICRQVMAEFCSKDFSVILGTPEKFHVYSLDEVLPFAFTPADL